MYRLSGLYSFIHSLIPNGDFAKILMEMEIRKIGLLDLFLGTQALKYIDFILVSFSLLVDSPAHCC